MTKYQWERELNQYLSDLPEIEKNKALEYYNELFNDKYDSGESEESIIASFGSPYAVASKIREEYNAERGNPTRAKDPNEIKAEGAIYSVLFVCLAVICWAAVIGLLISGICSIIGGVVFAIFTFADGGAVSYIVVGVAFILLAIGVGIVWGSILLIRLLKKETSKYSKKCINYGKGENL